MDLVCCSDLRLCDGGDLLTFDPKFQKWESWIFWILDSQIFTSIHINSHQYKYNNPNVIVHINHGISWLSPEDSSGFLRMAELFTIFHQAARLRIFGASAEEQPQQPHGDSWRHGSVTRRHGVTMSHNV